MSTVYTCDQEHTSAQRAATELPRCYPAMAVNSILVAEFVLLPSMKHEDSLNHAPFGGQQKKRPHTTPTSPLPGQLTDLAE